MTSNTSKLFVDLCKRGCILSTSTKYEYATKDLPKCLILVNENFLFEHDFVIKSIVSNNNYVTIGINGRAEYICKSGIYWFHFNYSDMAYASNLDLIAYYVHCGNEYGSSPYQNLKDFVQVIQCTNMLSFENISNYKQILKNKMIENLTDLYLIKFMYLTNNMLSLPEIKIVIIDTLFKLDKWDILEI